MKRSKPYSGFCGHIWETRTEGFHVIVQRKEPFPFFRIEGKLEIFRINGPVRDVVVEQAFVGFTGKDKLPIEQRDRQISAYHQILLGAYGNGLIDIVFHLHE